MDDESCVRRPSTSMYRALWISGTLQREAATCRTSAELAARLGVSEEGLKRSIYTMRQAGEKVPLLKEMLGRPTSIISDPPFHYPDVEYPAGGEADGDWEGEKTSPGMGAIPLQLEVGAEDGVRGPIHMEQDVPEGFRVKGLSTYYDADGKVVGQWVKTTQEQSSLLKAWLTALASLAEPWDGLHKPFAPGDEHDEDLLTIYPFGDPHIGMQAWAEECGEDFDVKIAERDIVAAVDHLVDLAPPSHTAIIVPLGDNSHVDGDTNTTTAGTPQDVDTRSAKVFRVIVRAFKRCIDRALSKHKRVVMYVIRGNHDWQVSLALAYCLHAYFEDDPRVEIDPSPAAFRWHRFGKNLFGFTHGDKVKKDDLPSIMACDQPRDWGETEYRKILIGHVHHDQVKEFRGCTVQSYRTLAPKDKYHTAHGYRSMQDMRCEVYHREYGPITQHSVGIAQIRKRTKAA